MLCNSKIVLCIVNSGKSYVYSSASHEEVQTIIERSILPSYEKNSIQYLSMENKVNTYSNEMSKEENDEDEKEKEIEFICDKSLDVKFEDSTNTNSDSSASKTLSFVGKKRHSNFSLAINLDLKEEEKDELANLRLHSYTNLSNLEKEKEKKMTFCSTNTFSTKCHSFKKVASKAENNNDSSYSVFNMSINNQNSIENTENKQKNEVNKTSLTLKNQQHNDFSSREIKDNNQQEQELRKVPVKTIVENNNNVLSQNHDFLKIVLKEKLKKDYFGENCTLSLEEMLKIIQNREHKRNKENENNVKSTI